MSWKLFALIALGIVAVLAPMLVHWGKAEPAMPPETAPPAAQPAQAPPHPTPEPAPEPEEQPLITWEEFQALRAGMTYNEALDIVGELETGTKQVYDEGVPGYTRPSMTVWYTWKNPDGSYGRLAFISDKLRRKEQEGLKPADTE